MNNTTIWLNENYKSIVVVIVFSILLWIFFKRGCQYNKLEWNKLGHPTGIFGKYNPTDSYKDMVKEFGHPDIIDRSKGGVAIWKKETLKSRGHCWERLEIRDEVVPHRQPAPHSDFMYTWYKLDVPKDKINDVRALSESVTYDPLKKLVRARCHFSHANVVTLLLAKRVATGEMTLEEAKTNYGPLIFSGIKSHDLYDDKAHQIMIDELCKYEKDNA